MINVLGGLMDCVAFKTVWGIKTDLAMLVQTSSNDHPKETHTDEVSQDHMGGFAWCGRR